MVKSFIRALKLLFASLFGRKHTVTLGLYGEPNTGKTTLANKIAKDWLGKTVGTVSDMPHETRTIQKAEHVEVTAGSRKIVMNLLDMPGLATHIDYKKFMQYYKTNSNSTQTKSKSKNKKGKRKKYTESEAKKIAEEATRGVVEAIKFLDKVDVVLAMMDSTRDPLSQVNIMLVGNLEAKGIPVILVANKTDLKSAKPENIKAAFPQHPVVPISALKGHNLDELYETIAQYS